MRKFLLCCAAAFCLVSAVMLGGCDVNEMSSLVELSKPYVGFYECETLTLGGEDVSDKFESVRLELAYGGDFELTYEDKFGNKGGYRGTYKLDPEAEEITFSAKTGARKVSYTFPYKNGGIFFDVPFGGKLFHAVFKMP